MRYLVGLFWTVIILLVVIFVALNSHTIELNYYVGKTELYLPLLLCLSIALGALFGILAMLPIYFRAKNDRRKSRKLLMAAEQELNQLRSASLKDDH